MNTLVATLVLSGCVLGGYFTFMRKNRRLYFVGIAVTTLIGFLFLPLWSTASVCEAFVIGLLLRKANLGFTEQLYRWQVARTLWFFINLRPAICHQITSRYIQAQLFIFGIYITRNQRG